MNQPVTESAFGHHVVVVGSAGDGEHDDIGAAVATAFGAAGARVAVVQQTRDAAERCVASMHAGGADALALGSDPREPEQIFAAAAEVSAAWPTVDVLVTTYLGTAHRGTAETLSVEHFDETIRVNLTSVFAATKAFLPLLRGGSQPSVVHVGSIDGVLGNPTMLAYTAAKGGVTTLVHVLAADLAPLGIRVNAIGRGASTATPVPEPLGSDLRRATPLGRFAEPEEYAAAILFLASPAASFITGALLPVDGGRISLTPGTWRSQAPDN